MSTHLVTGGARSGKSTLAERLVADLAGDGRVDYVATGFPASADDPEWAARVAAHRARRPASWSTLETLDLVGVLGAPSSAPVLIDCLGLWLTRVVDACRGWDGGSDESLGTAVDQLAAAVRATRRDVVLVTNEVGFGVVPDTAAGRIFRDWLGRTNLQVAAACERVTLCVCGISMPLKGAAPDA